MHYLVIIPNVAKNKNISPIIDVTVQQGFQTFHGTTHFGFFFCDPQQSNDHLYLNLFIFMLMKMS